MNVAIKLLDFPTEWGARRHGRPLSDRGWPGGWQQRH